MKTRYFSCPERADLDRVIAFEGNYYEDYDIVIDVVGKVNTNPSVYDDEGNIMEEKEPVWTDFLFNVRFKNDNKAGVFEGFNEEMPKTPFRRFL